MNALLGGAVAQDSQSPELFGKRLYSIRMKAGLTQAQLAERAGIHVITVSKLERGRTDPSWTMVNSLADALGVTPDSFLEADPDQPDDDAEPPARPTGKRK